MKLGKIEQVDVRTIWKHEAIDFTNWLALPENLELLSDEIDIDLALVGTEYNVGRFNVDIFAEETSGDRKIIIENQLERTDHDHLGKLITYASGLDAEIIIWIVKDVLEEHQQAIDWLNEHTDEKINFFAIKMEVWKIGESEPAPKFHIISKPNNWSKSVKQSVQSSTLTDLKQLQLNFWDGFKEFAQLRLPKLRLRKTFPQHWYDISFGRSDCHIGLTINSLKNEIGCEIYIPDSKETFDLFFASKIEIDEKIEGLQWFALENKKASRIRLIKKGDFRKQDKWPEYFEWLFKSMNELDKVFSVY